MTPPRVVTRGMGVGRSLRGASGTPPPTVCPGNGRRREVAAGWGHPALRMGIWKRPRGLRGHPFPGRRTVGAGHARPGGLRRQASMVRSVGRGLDPSAGGCPGDGRWRKVSRGVGDAAPYGLSGNGRRREPAPSSGSAGPPSPKGEGKGCCWRRRKPAPTPAAGPRCGAGGSGCSTSGLTKPALYRGNPGRCRGVSRR